MVEHEKSCGAIVFRKEKNNLSYLILYKEASGHYHESWDFPKGNAEAKENEQQAAAREIKEEASIIYINFIRGFRESINFFYRREDQLVSKEIVFLLAETTQEKVELSYEHQSYKWASYEEALQLLTHKNSKEILTKAHNFLEQAKQKTLKSILKENEAKELETTTRAIRKEEEGFKEKH